MTDPVILPTIQRSDAPGAHMITVIVPDTMADAKSAAKVALALAQSLEIQTDEDRKTVTADLRAIKARQKTVAAAIKAIREEFRQSLADVLDEYQPAADFLDAAANALNACLDRHDQELERRARELRAEAARQEAQRIAELQRQEREARERAEAEAAELRRMAAEAAHDEPETAAAIRAAVDATEAEREAAEAHARAEAERIAADAAAAQRKATAVAAPQIDGQYFRNVWKFRIVDLSAVPEEFLFPREVSARKVQSYIASLPDGSTPSAPGIEFFSERERVTKAER